MKARKAEDLRSLDDSELQNFLEEAEENITRLRFQNRLGQLDDTSNINTLRKDIARMKTILHERKTSDN